VDRLPEEITGDRPDPISPRQHRHAATQTQERSPDFHRTPGILGCPMEVENPAIPASQYGGFHYACHPHVGIPFFS